MIRFLNLKNQIIEGENTFAFYDTVNNSICSFDGEQFFDSRSEFEYVFNTFNVNLENRIQLLNRFIELIPLNYFDVIDNNKCTLTKDEILSTNNWYLSDYINSHEGYFWKHKSIEEDEYTFYMKRNINAGYTTIKEANNDITLFDGYIMSLEDLITVERLLQLHER